MDRRTFLVAAGWCAGAVTAGCTELDATEEWETVQECTEEVSIRVDSVGTALEEWLQSPQSFDSSRFDRLADETGETLETCQSDVQQRYEDIEDETIVPDEELDQHDGDDIVGLLQDLFDTAQDGQTAVMAVAEADADPDELTDDEETVVESVADEYDEVLDDVEPIVPDEH